MTKTMAPVFRSVDRRVFEACEEHLRAEKRWRRKVKKLIRELDPEGGRDPVVSGGWGSRRRLIGITADDINKIPEGWRLERKDWVLLPRRSTKEGKPIAAKIDACQPPPSRPALPGMPSDYFNGLSFCQPAIREIGDVIYVEWSDRVGDAIVPKVDRSIWEKIPLSEYYRAIEEHEGAKV